jgi:hypothetical protein
MKQEMYILIKDGVKIFEGSEDKVFCKLLDIQPMSTSWAIKYEGYKVVLKDKN